MTELNPLEHGRQRRIDFSASFKPPRKLFTLSDDHQMMNRGLYNSHIGEMKFV